MPRPLITAMVIIMIGVAAAGAAQARDAKLRNYHRWWPCPPLARR
jgi:hypothetical protein